MSDVQSDASLSGGGRLYLPRRELNKGSEGPVNIEVRGQNRVTRACRILGNTHVEEFNEIQVSENLKIRLQFDSHATTRPILNGVELIRAGADE